MSHCNRINQIELIISYSLSTILHESLGFTLYIRRTSWNHFFTSITRIQFNTIQRVDRWGKDVVVCFSYTQDIHQCDINSRHVYSLIRVDRRWYWTGVRETYFFYNSDLLILLPKKIHSHRVLFWWVLCFCFDWWRSTIVTLHVRGTRRTFIILWINLKKIESSFMSGQKGTEIILTQNQSIGVRYYSFPMSNRKVLNGPSPRRNKNFGSRHTYN